MELRAQRAQALAERNLAQVTLTRQQALAKTQAISKQDLDTATTELAVKQAQIGTIDAQIKRNQPRWIRQKPTSITPKSSRRWRAK